MFPAVGACLGRAVVSQSCTPGAGPPPFLASKPASFSSLAPPGFSAPGGKSPNVGVLRLSLCLLGLGLALGIFYQKKTAVRPVIWEGRVLGMDEPPLTVLLGSHSAVGQAPQGHSSRREAVQVGFPIKPSPSLPLLPSQWQERRETQNGRGGVGDPRGPGATLPANAKYHPHTVAFLPFSVLTLI